MSARASVARLGLFISATDTMRTTIDAVVENARWAEEHGFATGWVPHIPFSLDALIALAVAGRETQVLELGSAVVPTYPVHPLALARAAASAQAAAGGRLILGIGPSHPIVIRDMHGIDFDRPVEHVSEVIAVLRQAFDGGEVDHRGALFTATAPFEVPGSAPMPILVAALAPRMLRLAGEVADGTITYWADEHALTTHVIPRISAAADAANKPAPRVVAGVPVAVCDDTEAGRRMAAEAFGIYEQIPTYQRILARSRSSDPVDVAAVGTEAEVYERIRSYATSGATDLALSPIGLGASPEEREKSRQRTCEVLAAINNELRSGTQDADRR